MHAHLEIKLLHIFQIVVEVGSLSKAASRLRLTQSTISLQIKRLEEQVGMPLFERKTKPMRLTSAGQRLMNRNEQLLNMLDETLYFVRNEKARRQIRIGVTNYFADILLVDLAEKLLSEGQDVHIGHGTAEGLFQQFLDQKYDIIITTSNYDFKTTIYEYKICQQKLCGFVSHKLLNAHGEKRNIQSLMEKDLFVDFSIATHLGKLIKQYFFQKQSLPNKKITVDTIRSAAQLLESMGAWTIALPLSATIYESLFQSRKIECFSLKEPAPTEDLYLFGSSHLSKGYVDGLYHLIKTKLAEKIDKISDPAVKNLIEIV